MDNSELGQLLQDAKTDAMAGSLGKTQEEVFPLFLKEVNRSRFFLQEALDVIPADLLLSFDVPASQHNILGEVFRAKTWELLVEEELIGAKLLKILEDSLVDVDIRSKLSKRLITWAESIAKVKGTIYAIQMEQEFGVQQ